MTPDQLKDYVQAVIDGITPLAQKLGIAAENLFGWAIKHNYALAINNLIPLVTLIIFSIFLIYFSFKATWEEKEYGRVKVNGAGIFQIIFGVIVLINLIIALCTITTAIERIVAPEYMTTQDIIHMIQGKDGNNL